MNAPALLTCACAVLIAAAPMPLQGSRSDQDPGATAAQAPVFRAQSNLVVLHVNVFDRRSDAVPDLPQSAFVVVEDDKPQEIALFSSGDVPVTVGLVIDNSSSMITSRQMVIAGAGAFAGSSHPEDEMFSVIFNERVRFGLPSGAAFTKSGYQITASVTRFPAGGRTAIYDAVIAALGHLESATHQKRVLVVLSDGGDNASQSSRDDMLRKAAESDALIYTIARRQQSPEREDDPGLMKRLADLTGGLAYFPRTQQDVVSNFEEIAANIRRGYSIGYVPPAAGNPSYRKIKVHVLAPGRTNLSARVRDGYRPEPSAGSR